LTPYLISQPSEEPRLRLFCFHHAGGGASIFSGWPSVLGRLADVLPVQLPGRERRIREPRITDRAILVDELEHHLGPYLRRPYVFYGHSMGGLIAYDLAQQLLAPGCGTAGPGRTMTTGRKTVTPPAASPRPCPRPCPCPRARPRPPGRTAGS
jgi:pimeloyl-ACP methyl ester carboxylesterase